MGRCHVDSGRKLPDGIFAGGKLDFIGAGKGSRGIGVSGELGVLADWHNKRVSITYGIRGAIDPAAALVGKTKSLTGFSPVVGLFWNLGGDHGAAFSFGGLSANYSVHTLAIAGRALSKIFGSSSFWDFASRLAADKGSRHLKAQVGVTYGGNTTFLKLSKGNPTTSSFGAGFTKLGGLHDLTGQSASNVFSWAGGSSAAYYKNPAKLSSKVGSSFSF